MDLLRTVAGFGKFRERLDGWVNAITGLGGSRDATIAARLCHLRVISDNEVRILYHSNDLAARIVHQLVQDALRQGIDAGEDDKITDALDRLHALDRVGEADIWGRAYGGCLLVFGAGSEDMAEPWGEVRKGSLTWIRTFDKRYCSVQKYDANGDPESYYVTNRRGGTFVVHASRAVVFGGALTSDDIRDELGGWDLSVLNRAYEILRDVDMSWRAAQNILQNASLGVMKIKDLAEMISSAKDKLQDRMEIVDMSRSVSRSILVDADYEDFRFEGAQNIGGVSDVFRNVFLQRLAAAADMPLTVLMGVSPAGLNATGESDIRLWYDKIQQHRTKVLEPRLIRVIEIVAADAGIAWDGKFEWPSLWQRTPDEEDAHAESVAKVDTAYFEMGALLPEEVTQRRFAEDPEWAPIIEPEDRAERAAPAEAAPIAGAEGETVQDQALNGAQIAALVQIGESLVAGKISRNWAQFVALKASPEINAAELARAMSDIPERELIEPGADNGGSPNQGSAPAQGEEDRAPEAPSKRPPDAP